MSLPGSLPLVRKSIYLSIYTSDLLYPFISQWTFISFHILAIANTDVMNIGVHEPSGIVVFP